MRQLELSTPLPASVDAAWAALVDVENWPRWGKLVVSARGEFTPGSRWTMRLRERRRGPRQMRPYFVSMQAPQQIVFETRLGTAWAVTMRHSFELEAAEDGDSLLWQRFEARGALVRPLWRMLREGMLQFDELGDDLARHLGEQAAGAPAIDKLDPSACASD